MQYDFISMIDRCGKDALCLDQIPVPGATVREGFDRIPMWVADMSFATAPSVVEAMQKRLEHPLFGYYMPSEAYYQAILRWHQRHKGMTDLEKKHISYENGVLGGVVSALNVFCSRGDKVLVHAPTYVGFRTVLANNGYKTVVTNLLREDDGTYRMNLAEMEEILEREHIHAAIFCNPHNPTGRVWTRDEIADMMELFRKYNVYVVSDEIWSDVLFPGVRHTPTQSVSEDAKQRTVALYAPSKTFNIAGIVGAYRVVYNDWIRDRLDKEESLTHYNVMNLFSMHALVGAYRKESEEWVAQLGEVLEKNATLAREFVLAHFPGVKPSKPEGTYMFFLDCRDWLTAHNKTIDELLREGIAVGVIWQDGRDLGAPGHIRLNLALPTARVQEALDRLNQHVFGEDARW